MVSVTAQLRGAALLWLCATLGTGCVLHASVGGAFEAGTARRDTELVVRAQYGQLRLGEKPPGTPDPLIGFFGAQVVMVPDIPVELRSVSLIAPGMTARCSPRFAVDLAIEMGIGSPTAREFSDTGVLLGAVVTPVLRLTRTGYEGGFEVLGPLVDWVLDFRGGHWMRGRGGHDDSMWEVSVTTGLRVTLTSDLFESAPQGVGP